MSKRTNLWHSATTKPSRRGYYDVRSRSGEGWRIWARGQWWQQDYRMQWMPMQWESGALEWRRQVRDPHALPYGL